ncbi:hypothetical protein HY500_00500 [Candidatus Woesearchaeota archaeon]|nr:hypothetical protein [Candidatus Woesearchaeota archaeon]
MGEFIEKNNPKIDVLELESQIKENMHKRKEQVDGYGKAPAEFQLPSSSIPPNLYSMANIHIPRVITSHHPVVGQALVKIRQLFEEEMRLSLGPVVQKQISFNRKLIEYMTNEFQGCHEFDLHLRERIERLERLFDESNIQINQNVKEIFRIERKLRGQK